MAEIGNTDVPEAQDAVRVSVVMPTYNAERYLAQAIDSVLAQTYRDFEFIIVNDGSSDGTLEIAEAYARKDPRIRIVSQENQGGAASRNNGMAIAHGEWIAMMDADDVMLPNRLERQLAFLEENPDVAVASAFVYHIDDRNRIIGQNESEMIDRETLKRKLKNDAAFGFSHPAAILNKKAVQEVGGYRPQFEPCEDSDLWNRVAENGHTVLVQQEFLLKYRIHVNSVCALKVREQVETRRWMEESLRRRRRGEPEPTWEEYQEIRRQMSWLARFREYRANWGKVLYKTAVNGFVEGRYHVMIPTLLAAFVMTPRTVRIKVWSKFLKPRMQWLVSKTDRPDQQMLQS